MNPARIRTAFLTGGLSEAARLLDRSDPSGNTNILAPAADAIDRITLPTPPPLSSLGHMDRVNLKTETGPVGWLGWLVNHGLACLSFELAYMEWHESLWSPRLKGVWHSTGNGYVELETAKSYLMTQRFYEAQSPTWGQGFGPCFAYNADRADGGVINGSDSALKSWIDSRTSEGDSPPGESLTRYRLDPDAFATTLEAGTGRPHYSRVIGMRPALVAHRYRNHWMNSDTVNDRVVYAAHKAQAGFEGGQLTPPPSWASDPALKRLWASRIVRWFDNALWLVWACEMARIHSQARRWTAPDWWVSYANAWCVAVWGDMALGTREAYDRYECGDTPTNQASKACRLPGVTFARWERVARALMAAAPIPGTVGYLGEQIAPQGARRHILDMPAAAGSLRPPMYVRGLYARYIQRWCAGESFPEAAVVAAKWINSIIGVIGSVCGGSAVSSCISSMQTAFSSCCALLRVVASVANGGDGLTLGDVGDIVGNLCAATSSIAAVTGVSVDEMLPDNVWSALKTAGAAIPEWGGVLSTTAKQEAVRLQGRLSELVEIDRWPYLDEALGAVIPGNDPMI